MGSDRRKYQDKTASEIPMKLHEIFSISREEAYNFYIHYNMLKSNKINTNEVLEALQHDFGNKFILYFTALSMELLNKEITKGLI